MHIRIIVEVEDEIPISYLHEFTVFLKKFRYVKDAYWERVPDDGANNFNAKGFGENYGHELQEGKKAL